MLNEHADSLTAFEIERIESLLKRATVILHETISKNTSQGRVHTSTLADRCAVWQQPTFNEGNKAGASCSSMAKSSNIMRPASTFHNATTCDPFQQEYSLQDQEASLLVKITYECSEVVGGAFILFLFLTS